MPRRVSRPWKSTSDPNQTGMRKKVLKSRARRSKKKTRSPPQELGPGSGRKVGSLRGPARRAPLPPRRSSLLLGTAKVLLLSLVAEADAHNWERLTDRLRTVQGSGEEKAELVERLEELAEARSSSRKGLLESAAQERQRLNALSQEQQEYLGRLSPAMRELEKRNPVGPTTGTALITTNRLSADIAAGVPIWVARRAQRARERAARKQAQAPKAPREAAGSGQRNPDEAADLLDDDLRKAAARDLREFRQELV